MKSGQLSRYTGLSILTILIFLVGLTPLQADRIMVVGDSWARPMVKPLREILAENGHRNVIVDKAATWLTADELSDNTGLNWISDWLETYPDTNIVHLSIGANDWMGQWTPAWTDPELESQNLGKVVSRVEIIVDHILSIDPTMKIVWSSYDYFRPKSLGTPAQLNGAQDAMSDLSAQLAMNKPGLSFLNLNGTLQVFYGFDGIAHTGFDPSVGIPPGDPSLPDPDLPSPFVAFKPNDREHLTEEGYKVIVQKQYDLFYSTALTEQALQINPGLNDAWYNPTTAGQGFLISVLPQIKQIFLAWFTFDTQRPPEDVTALLGEPGHRWLTAQGPYDGDTANLTIYLTEGGIFDTAEPAPSTDPAGDGTLTLEFADCTEGLVHYEITSLGISGDIPIQRLVPDNVPLCGSFQQQLQQ